MSPADECNTDKSLSYQLAQRYLNGRKIEATMNEGVLQFGDKIFPKLEPHSGGYQQPILGGYEIMLNYRATSQIAQQVSLREILTGSIDRKLPNLVKDRVILIGTIARSYNDYRFTPYGEIPESLFKLIWLVKY